MKPAKDKNHYATFNEDLFVRDVPQLLQGAHITNSAFGPCQAITVSVGSPEHPLERFHMGITYRDSNISAKTPIVSASLCCCAYKGFIKPRNAKEIARLCYAAQGLQY